MSLIDVREPQKPFPLLYNEFKRDIVSTIQNYVQKGVPYCCISEAMNEFSRQCAENTNLEFSEASSAYDRALQEYADAVNRNNVQEVTTVDTPESESVTDGQI